MLIVGLTCAVALSTATAVTTTLAFNKRQKQQNTMSFEGLRVDTENLPVLKNDLIIRAAKGEEKLATLRGSTYICSLL